MTGIARMTEMTRLQGSYQFFNKKIQGFSRTHFPFSRIPTTGLNVFFSSSIR